MPCPIPPPSLVCLLQNPLLQRGGGVPTPSACMALRLNSGKVESSETECPVMMAVWFTRLQAGIDEKFTLQAGRSLRFDERQSFCLGTRPAAGQCSERAAGGKGRLDQPWWLHQRRSMTQRGRWSDMGEDNRSSNCMCNGRGPSSQQRMLRSHSADQKRLPLSICSLTLKRSDEQGSPILQVLHRSDRSSSVRCPSRQPPFGWSACTAAAERRPLPAGKKRTRTAGTTRKSAPHTCSAPRSAPPAAALHCMHSSPERKGHCNRN